MFQKLSIIISNIFTSIFRKDMSNLEHVKKSSGIDIFTSKDMKDMKIHHFWGVGVRGCQACVGVIRVRPTIF